MPAELHVIGIPHVNPEPWRVGPIATSRYGKGGKLGSYVAPDPALATYQEALREVFRQLQVPPLDRGYHLRFWWWRKIEQYRGKTRMVTKNAVDQTNLQKAAEDALQPCKAGDKREAFDGVIDNDRYCLSTGGLIIRQDKEVETPLIIVEIVSGTDLMSDTLLLRPMTVLVKEVATACFETSEPAYLSTPVPWAYEHTSTSIDRE